MFVNIVQLPCNIKPEKREWNKLTNETITTTNLLKNLKIQKGRKNPVVDRRAPMICFDLSFFGFVYIFSNNK